MAPPQDEVVKVRIEKTADWVLKNGTDFEQVILQKNAENSTFAFLDPATAADDPQRAYYLWIRDMKARQQCQKHAAEAPAREMPTREEWEKQQRREELKQ